MHAKLVEALDSIRKALEEQEAPPKSVDLKVAVGSLLKNSFIRQLKDIEFEFKPIGISISIEEVKGGFLSFQSTLYITIKGPSNYVDALVRDIQRSVEKYNASRR